MKRNSVPELVKILKDLGNKVDDLTIILSRFAENIEPVTKKPLAEMGIAEKIKLANLIIAASGEE